MSNIPRRAALLGLAGFAVPRGRVHDQNPLRPANAGSAYCYRIGKSYRGDGLEQAQAERRGQREFGGVGDHADGLGPQALGHTWLRDSGLDTGRQTVDTVPKTFAPGWLQARTFSRHGRRAQPANGRFPARPATSWWWKLSDDLGLGPPPRTRNDRRRTRTHAQSPTGRGRWLRTLAGTLPYAPADGNAHDG